PPDKFGNACGAKVPSSAVRSGGGSWAYTDVARRSAPVVESRNRIMELPRAGPACISGDYSNRNIPDKMNAQARRRHVLGSTLQDGCWLPRATCEVYSHGISREAENLPISRECER